MSSRPITDDLVAQVAEDLRSRYGLDDQGLSELGARLADASRATRAQENVAFAESFVAEHRETFGRLAT